MHPAQNGQWMQARGRHQQSATLHEKGCDVVWKCVWSSEWFWQWLNCAGQIGIWMAEYNDSCWGAGECTWPSQERVNRFPSLLDQSPSRIKKIASFRSFFYSTVIFLLLSTPSLTTIVDVNTKYSSNTIQSVFALLICLLSWNIAVVVPAPAFMQRRVPRSTTKTMAHNTRCDQFGNSGHCTSTSSIDSTDRVGQKNQRQEPYLNMLLALFLQAAAILCCLMFPLRARISQDTPSLLSNLVGWNQLVSLPSCQSQSQNYPHWALTVAVRIVINQCWLNPQPQFRVDRGRTCPMKICIWCNWRKEKGCHGWRLLNISLVEVCCHFKSTIQPN